MISTSKNTSKNDFSRYTYRQKNIYYLLILSNKKTASFTGPRL